MYNIIEGIIKEPTGGAHYEPEVAYKNLKTTIMQAIKELSSLDDNEIICDVLSLWKSDI